MFFFIMPLPIILQFGSNFSWKNHATKLQKWIIFRNFKWTDWLRMSLMICQAEILQLLLFIVTVVLVVHNYILVF